MGATTTAGSILEGAPYNQAIDSFYQNVRMMQALTAKGYDMDYSWGSISAGQKMGGACRGNDALALARPRFLQRPGEMQSSDRSTCHEGRRKAVSRGLDLAVLSCCQFASVSLRTDGTTQNRDRRFRELVGDPWRRRLLST